MYRVKRVQWPVSSVRNVFVFTVLYKYNIHNLAHTYKCNIYMTFGTKELSYVTTAMTAKADSHILVKPPTNADPGHNTKTGCIPKWQPSCGL